MSDKEKHMCINACGAALIAIGMGFHLYTGSVLWWFGALSACYPLAIVEMLFNGTPVRWREATSGVFIVGLGLALTISHDHIGYWLVAFLIGTLMLSHFFNRQFDVRKQATVCEDEMDLSG